MRYFSCNLFRVIWISEPCHWHGNEIRIAEIGGAIGIGAAHGLRHQMYRLERIGGPEVERTEDVQHFNQRDTAGARGRNGYDFIAVVMSTQRLANFRLIVFQVLCSN